MYASSGDWAASGAAVTVYPSDVRDVITVLSDAALAIAEPSRSMSSPGGGLRWGLGGGGQLGGLRKVGQEKGSPSKFIVVMNSVRPVRRLTRQCERWWGARCGAVSQVVVCGGGKATRREDSGVPVPGRLAHRFFHSADISQPRTRGRGRGEAEGRPRGGRGEGPEWRSTHR